MLGQIYFHFSHIYTHFIRIDHIVPTTIQTILLLVRILNICSCPFKFDREERAFVNYIHKNLLQRATCSVDASVIAFHDFRIISGFSLEMAAMYTQLSMQ